VKRSGVFSFMSVLFVCIFFICCLCCSLPEVSPLVWPSISLADRRSQIWLRMSDIHDRSVELLVALCDHSYCSLFETAGRFPSVVAVCAVVCALSLDELMS